MSIAVRAATVVERPDLEVLVEIYQRELSSFTGCVLDGARNFPPYKYLPDYWRDPQRHPYLIEDRNGIVGFALVRRDEKMIWQIAEFFVSQGQRRCGIGQAAAMQVFACHPGQWVVRQLPEHRTASSFWRQVISSATGGSFTEHVIDGAPEQRFMIT